MLNEKLLLHEDELLKARHSVHGLKKESLVLNKKSLLVNDNIHEIRKEVQLIKNELKASRKDSHDIKNDINTFINDFEKLKRESIDRSEQCKKARIDHIVSKLEKHDEKIDKLHAKLCNSTKISTMKRLRNEAKE